MTKTIRCIVIIMISVVTCALFFGVGGILGWKLTIESQKPKEVEIVLWHKLSRQEIIISGPNRAENPQIEVNYVQGEDKTKYMEFQVLIRRRDNKHAVNNPQYSITSDGTGTSEGELPKKYTNVAIYRGSYTFYYSFNEDKNDTNYSQDYIASNGTVTVYIK